MKLARNQKKESPKVLVPLMEAAAIAREALRAFQSENEVVFTKSDVLRQKLEVAENELKTAAKRLGAGYETEEVGVEYVMPQHRYLDVTKIRELVSAKILDSLNVITKHESVDERVLKALVRAKKIHKSVLTNALIEEPTGSPRVSITYKE